MRFPSSIFSFDTLRVTVRTPRAILLAVGLLVALDFGVSRADWPYKLLHRRGANSYVGEFLDIEDRLSASKVEPRIVILGNSRSQCGLLGTELEAALHLPSGSVLNLSVRAGDHFDNFLLYRRNRDCIKRAPLVIYAIDAYQWNRRMPLSERFFHFADLEDRWKLDRTPASFIAWVFRTAQTAGLYHAFAEELAKGFAARSTAVPAEGAGQREADAVGGVYPVGRRVEWWYADFTLSLPREASLVRIVRNARQDGQRVVLVQLPAQDAFVDQVLATHADHYRAYLDRARNIPGVEATFVFERASDCGLAARDFKDWDHLAETGAVAFSRVLAERLQPYGSVLLGKP